MIKVQPQEYETYYQWVVNTQTRWCSFVVQRYFYDDGVVLEEIDPEDYRILEQYVLDGFNPKSLPFFNQEKDQIIVITLKEI
jgi:hypothetical protein